LPGCAGGYRGAVSGLLFRPFFGFVHKKRLWRGWQRVGGGTGSGLRCRDFAGRRRRPSSTSENHSRELNEYFSDQGAGGGQKIVPGQAVPDNPIIPFIEGDGIGVDITPVMIKVIDAAVEKAYGGKKKIHWMEVYAGEKSTQLYGPDEWLPKETFALKEYSVSIKGPMTTPVGGGIRSSTWPCARSSTSTSACARCSISRACRRR
jgi:hypothetical protein